MAPILVLGSYRWVTRLWVMVALAILLWPPGLAQADETCKGGRPMNPRNSRLNVLEIGVGQGGIAGRIKNTSGDRAVGVMIWVNYFRSVRGGLVGQQCIAVGDLASGEERRFQAPRSMETLGAESWTHAAEALDWK